MSECKTCKGVGRYVYSNTATYMSEYGKLHGSAPREDICDVCWGSGDSDHPFRNLREIIKDADPLRHLEH